MLVFHPAGTTYCLLIRVCKVYSLWEAVKRRRAASKGSLTVKLNYERVSLNKMESVREGGGRERSREKKREREGGIPGALILPLFLSLSLSLSLSLCCVFRARGRACSFTRYWVVNGEWNMCCAAVCVWLTSRLSVHRCSHSKNGTTKEAPEDLRSVSDECLSESERTFWVIFHPKIRFRFMKVSFASWCYFQNK